MQVQLMCELTKIPNIFDVGGNFHDVFNTHVLYSKKFAKIMGLLELEGENNYFCPFMSIFKIVLYLLPYQLDIFL